MFQCLRERAPECIDEKLDNGEDAISLGTIFKIGLTIFSIEVTDCTDCTNFPQVGQYTEYHTHQP